jgi:twitching motility protein PilT
VSAAFGTVILSDALHAAHARHASDLHVVAGLPPVLRIDGKLDPWEGPSLSPDDVREFAAKLLDEAAMETLERCGDATTSLDYHGSVVRVHAARAGETTLSLRFLSREAPAFADLDMPRIVAELAYRFSGLLLFAGPTGSGKSTTLASLVALMNVQLRRKIVTIEDPVEYRFASENSIVVQRQIGRDVPSFAQAVMGALRSDPDVIVIGEMRDAETIAAALTAAETGHLVLATVHAAEAAQCVDRVVNAFSETGIGYARARLAQSLVAICVQRLVEKANGNGRRPIVEIAVATDAVRHLIRDGKHHQLASVIETGRQFGMQTFRAHLEELVARGEVRGDAAEHDPG